MFERHRNRKIYFEEQGITTKKFVIPYIEQIKSINSSSRILEIGCGEGGNIAPFLELGCQAYGVDLNARQIENAKEFLKDLDEHLVLLSEDIYEVSQESIGLFDVIMLRDVIEHIPDQKTFMGHLSSFLKPDGLVFFGFPPWTMPFGGHQQVCKSKFLSKLPYFHLLPGFIYKSILRVFGENEATIRELMHIKSTGLSINSFHNYLKSNDLKIIKKDYFLINPNYETKFGLKPRKQFGLISRIPYLRDFVTTCVYCLVKKES